MEMSVHFPSVQFMCRPVHHSIPCSSIHAIKIRNPHIFPTKIKQDILKPRIAAFAALLLLTSMVFAQSENDVIVARSESGGQEYRFTVEETDPKDMNRLFVGAIPIGMEVGAGFWLGFGLDAHYRLNENLILNGSWFRPYIKGTDSEVGEYYDDRGDGLKLRLYNHTELGGTFSFSDNVKLKKVKMVLKETGGSTERVVYLLQTEVPNHTRLGGRFGYSYYQQSAGGTLKISPDTTASGNEVSLTSFTMHSLYVGFSTTSFQHFVVSNSDFGTPRHSRWRSFYADLMIGLGGARDFHTFSESAAHNVPYDLSTSNAINRLGYRIGWERVNQAVTGKHFGMMMGAELGSRPVPDLSSYNDSGNHKISKGYFAFRFALLYTK